MNAFAKHWYGLVNRPDGSISRTNLTTTIAWIVATVWISVEVWQKKSIDWELLTIYLAFATGNSGWNKYLAVTKGQQNERNGNTAET